MTHPSEGSYLTLLIGVRAYVKRAPFALVLILTACGSPSGTIAHSSIQPTAAAVSTPPATPNSSPTLPATPSSSPTPSATASPGHVTPPAAGLLFAAVEGGSLSLGSQPGTVVIVGMDGYARAKATFQSRVGPVVPDAYTPVQPVAQVAGSGVYYIDRAGTVRVLRVGSQPLVVARFPLQPAQEDAWFAVSPDGSRVLAGIMTLPALGPLVPGTSWPTYVGPWKFDLESAPAGGQSKTLVHFESSAWPESWKPIFPVGWTSGGPVAMVPAYVTSQNAWPGGPLYQIDDAGKKTTQLGGSDCNSASITSKGFIPCQIGTSGVVTVRDEAGKVVWLTHVDGFAAWSLNVSADGQAILNDSQVERHATGIVPMPSGFRVQGWLDTNTVVGRVQQQNGDEGDLLWISLGDPRTVHDLGFKGDFVATLA